MDTRMDVYRLYRNVYRNCAWRIDCVYRHLERLVMAYVVMADIVMAYIVTIYIFTAYTVMAYIVMAH